MERNLKQYLEAKHKTDFLWQNFSPEKRDQDWYKSNVPTSSPFVEAMDPLFEFNNPVPVSVRHPTRLDCDEDGRCWWFYEPVADQHDGCWQFESNALYRYPRYWPTHWLPANTPFPIP